MRWDVQTFPPGQPILFCQMSQHEYMLLATRSPTTAAVSLGANRLPGGILTSMGIRQP